MNVVDIIGYKPTKKETIALISSVLLIIVLSVIVGFRLHAESKTQKECKCQCQTEEVTGYQQ